MYQWTNFEGHSSIDETNDLEKSKIEMGVACLSHILQTFWEIISFKDLQIIVKSHFPNFNIMKFEKKNAQVVRSGVKGSMS